ncbi:hypothetical protein ABHI18_000799 [Aspergillus niger]
MYGVQAPTGAVGTDKDRGESETLDNYQVKEEHKVLTRERPSTENATSRSEVSVSFIDTLEGISEVIEALMNSPVTPPSIYIDLEGMNLGREGPISIVQIFLYPQHHVYLVDVHTLGATAFDHAATTGKTLRSIFGSDGIPEVFFDVRNDSAAMFHQYQVELAGIYDLQVMEVVTRARPGNYLAGLAKCISRDAPMTPSEKASWRATKERGKTLFSPQHGGSYKVFNARPLSREVVEYCVQDVQFLPRLWQTYSRALNPTLRQKVQAEVRNRIVLSQSPQFNGKGINMVLAPQISETKTECPSSWL